MNEEGGAQGAAANANAQPGADADMEFVAGSSLPPIDDARRKHKDKAAMKAAKEAKEESLEEKKEGKASESPATVDQTYEIVRKKVQVFEEVDIDQISEFILPVAI